MGRASSDRAERQMAWGLVLLGVASRLVPHPWNATPVMAIALFGGAYLPKRWSLLVPLLIVAGSDLILGWHSTVPFTWGAFLLAGMIGWWLRPHPRTGRIIAGAVGGSVLFFLITNLGVWAVGGLYPRTADGLWSCYVAGTPFFRNSLLGDLVYTAALFTAHRFAASLAARPAKIAA